MDINFEIKCHSLCVSLMRDTNLHPSLSMATIPIEEVDVIEKFGYSFWS